MDLQSSMYFWISSIVGKSLGWRWSDRGLLLQEWECARVQEWGPLTATEEPRGSFQLRHRWSQLPCRVKPSKYKVVRYLFFDPFPPQRPFLTSVTSLLRFTVPPRLLREAVVWIGLVKCGNDHRPGRAQRGRGQPWTPSVFRLASRSDPCVAAGARWGERAGGPLRSMGGDPRPSPAARPRRRVEEIDLEP